MDGACGRPRDSPFAVRTAPGSEVQPDVIVTRYADLTPTNLPLPPLLAVEVLSRSTALYDRNTKRAHYERRDWILDPTEPGRLTVLELDADGRYAEMADVAGDAAFHARAAVCGHRGPGPAPGRLAAGLSGSGSGT
ncbi:MAG: Uma2 family endonuclease [Geodermatophilaceae bacterium]|nr:Uma2 family endonuclease [Geodermatophilaceae bacterium]